MGQVTSIPITNLRSTFQTVFYAVFLTFLLSRVRASYKYRRARQNCDKKIIFVTGCDSGLGFKLAAHARELGFMVFAACLNPESDGAKMLKAKWRGIQVVEMDVTKKESVENATKHIEEFLRTHEDHVLWSVVNNAGVLVFGEFEWLTEDHLLDQFSVNTFGTMRVTQRLLPLMRHGKGKNLSRIIAITSHCAFEPLPGIAAYGATKAALVAWIDGLRCELRPHGVCVTQLVPGRVEGTKIMSNTRAHSQEMWEEMSEEQREYYQDQFERYYAYLDGAGTIEGTFPSEFNDSDTQLRKAYEHALFDQVPQRKYLCEPWQYTFYRLFAAISPTTSIRDYVTVKFVRTPQWRPKK